MPVRHFLTSLYCKTVVTFRYVRSDGLSGFRGVFMYQEQPITPYIGVCEEGVQVPSREESRCRAWRAEVHGSNSEG